MDSFLYGLKIVVHLMTQLVDRSVWIFNTYMYALDRINWVWILDIIALPISKQDVLGLGYKNWWVFVCVESLLLILF
jgi:hypothetical protein